MSATSSVSEELLGCFINPVSRGCFSCPLDQCIYDQPKSQIYSLRMGVRRHQWLDAWETAVDAGYSIREANEMISQQYGIEQRSISRARQRVREGRDQSYQS